MRSLYSFYRRSVLAAAAAAALAAAGVPVAHAAPADGGARYLVYVPSDSSSADHAANVRAFEERGFSVVTVAATGESDRAHRVREEVDALLAGGVAPGAVTVVGAGSGSPAVALASSAAANRQLNYVLLGNCDERLADDPSFHMSGRVLGLRDAGDRGSLSCRRLWRNAPKLGERRDVVLHTGLGAALFDAPRQEWLQPLSAWSRGGSVDVGDVKVAATP